MKLFCRRYGNGPPLIILHGLYGSSDNWMTVARNISTKFSVYLPDLRNHGNSPHDDVHDFQSITSDLLELAESYRLDKFFLAGHSMGGKAAIHFTLRWPEKINGLLVADISPFTDTDSFSMAYEQHSRILQTIIDTDISAAVSRKEIEKLLSDQNITDRNRALVLKNVQRLPNNKYTWKLNAPALLNNLDKIIEGLRRPSKDDNAITGFRVIFLKGEKSDYLNTGDYKDILRLFPSAEFRIIEGAGHWIQADRPAEVAEALEDLLDL